MIAPNARYLRRLVLALHADQRTPLVVRAECNNLVLAIGANDLDLVRENLQRLQVAAKAEGFALPSDEHADDACGAIDTLRLGV
jgi:hypothetical protein